MSSSYPYDTPFLSGLSSGIGWSYTIAWSISFWPQAILNFRRKSSLTYMITLHLDPLLAQNNILVTGLSFEFLAYNITGFLFYSTYSTITYLVQHDPSLYPSGQYTVEINDLAFGYHAVIMTSITIIQVFMYKTKRQSVHPIHAYICSSLWVILLYTIAVSRSPGTVGYLSYYRLDQGSGFSLIDYMGYAKVFISCIKYMPQAYLNYCRKSTVGWSIVNILLDITGGTLSYAQQCLDAYRANNVSIITGNIPKLLLALESIFFDVLFIVQHYVLYTDRHDEGNKEDDEEEELDEKAAAAARLKDDKYLFHINNSNRNNNNSTTDSFNSPYHSFGNSSRIGTNSNSSSPAKSGGSVQKEKHFLSSHFLE